MRQFDSGATRDDDGAKYDFDGFLSPLALDRYAEYMHGHRIQSDGSLRDSDNWQKGIPQEQYRKSLFRHMLDAWKLGRGYTVNDRVTGKLVTLEDSLCGVLFNAFGWLHEHLKERDTRATKVDAIALAENSGAVVVHLDRFGDDGDLSEAAFRRGVASAIEYHARHAKNRRARV